MAANAIRPAPATDLRALFDALDRAGVALGVATHDTEEQARVQLADVGALDRFAFIAGYDSGHGVKPGPGMLEAFCAATGLRAEDVAVVGDSLHDLHLGRRNGAGITIAVLTGPSGRDELAPHADLVLDSIADLPAALGLV